MSEVEIVSHAENLRAKLERLAHNRTEPYHKVIGSFPHSFCLNCARLLCRYFHEILGVRKDELKLCSNALSEDGMSHAWCIICGYHVDVTADQFEGAAPVIVAATHPMIGYFCEPDVSGYDDSQNIGSDWRYTYYEPLFRDVQNA